ncbi:alpha/beta hydrolase [Tenacibaculum finnmarkense]|uniref:alpha/beta hydrolase n=1 Tax=Tenacibaculum finnmarkense TaxID=2781243 RepID=UPI001E2F9215|nr:alpha/beta hydrolase-fold protein [Tenacibaculum finnmarkense]MCD8447859.1 dienelactone hydrolase family protein [Tenacibaculum finnmarkense genomovar finnmarkense]MCG8206940.1 dienelactone hydrolase family protein [Tenacibaculum finnmarkense genomovar finnmarkense]MCG8723122.1 phospholipase [Tenacibaculum finnmarkense]MCG8741351.1 phospholipase [Tenacibaculum finnmarkense]MCG8764696.1 phospholipase [Tenacibaculum finnmarkense]
MLNYIVREPKQATTNPPLLILLHGYGSNEDDLFSFAQELPEDLLIVSAQAPYQMGGGAFAWYAINFDAVKGKFSDLEQAATSVTKIAGFIDEIKEKYNTNPDKTFVLGFSQGAILSYALSLNYPNKVQHVIALSGYIDENLIKNQQENTKITTDYYISHGTVDQVIPVDWARKAPVFLEENNLKNEYSEYNVGHGVAPQNFYSFKTWIENRL